MKNHRTIVFPALLVIGVLLFASLTRLAWGWTNPAANPPAGGAALFLDGASSNFGIGTLTPGAKLEVRNAAADAIVKLSRGATTSTLFRVGADTSFVIQNQSTDALIIQSGNVGIGGTPGAKLDVVGGLIRGNAGLTISAGAVSVPAGEINNAELENSSFTVSAGAGLSGGGVISLGSAGSISLNVGNANTWTAAQTFSSNTNFPGSGIWNSSGNVGIGTATPQSRLQISGDYIQVSTVTGSVPPSTDCNEAAEAGRMIVRTDGPKNLYICLGTGGWKDV
ncbi:hypothetical protein HY504_01095 [Candidatus Wolfebacteria bacterium]|nr:hypothetical protein [Candidatus Wolfebacteria bacterium]